MPTKCPQCQAENPGQSKFCAECGSRLSGAGEIGPGPTMTVGVGLPFLGKGQTFAGKYTILGEVGRGGMGVVYKAEDIQLRRTVALKFLPPELGVDPDVRERFLREARSAAALSHPNICVVHEVGEADGRPYIAMEFVDGLSLRQQVVRGPFDPDTAAEIGVQIASGLEAAHQRGIVHRDIKSANIMVTAKGQAKIMDFGLAKMAGESQLTRETSTVGTIAYMSPEQARGEDLDARTDIWSFGVVLYELLTGQLPFRGDRESVILHAIMGTDPKPLRELRMDIPVDLQKIVDLAMRKKREDRYGSAEELARDLRVYREGRKAEEAGFFNLRTLAKRMKRPAYFAPASVVLVALGCLAYLVIHRGARARWAREVALPQIESLIRGDNMTAAYRLAKQAAGYIPNDQKLKDHLILLTAYLTATTDPPGAQFLIKEYGAPDSAYELVGSTPFEKAPIPDGYQQWKIAKDGFEPVEGARWFDPPQSLGPIDVRLDAKGTLPPGMVRVQPGPAAVPPDLGGMARMPALELEAFLLDKFEVTNKEYKKFLEDGGYRRQEFWKEPLVRDGGDVPWNEATSSFVDRTGRPGPATWEFGAYPDGQDEYPVRGVSWFEAAAYAAYAGKSLPTVYHWRSASGDRGMAEASYIIPLCNFGGKGPVPVGQMRGISPAGIFDMAGNVKEWCLNETVDGKRANLGGAWDEPNYMFAQLDRYSPWFRYENFGFRCMKTLVASPADAAAAIKIPLTAPPPSVIPRPCSEEVFQAYLRLYTYAKTPLNARIEERRDWSGHTVFEWISFDPAYEAERSGAYLFIPKEGQGPYQTIVHWPGAGARMVNSFREYFTNDGIADIYTKTGRALVIPILRDTFGRRLTPEIRSKAVGAQPFIERAKDFMRTIDYLETRPEFDTAKLAFEGTSWGANMGPMMAAIEKRLKAVVLVSPTLIGHLQQPEASQFNFAPRLTAPVLIQCGRYDFLASATSIEEGLRPLLNLFGTPSEDRSFIVYETGHAVWSTMKSRQDEVDFLDKYLGTAKK